MSYIQTITNKLQNIISLSDLELFEKEVLGPDSEIMKNFRELPNLPSAEEKKKVGNELNKQKTEILSLLENKKAEIEKIDIQNKLLNWQDITFEKETNKLGKLNIITQVRWEIEDIFQKMGFEIEYPYEIDSEYNNFECVNIPAGHPARDSWDTFFTDQKNNILITHTSSMQNRILKKMSRKESDLENGFLGSAVIGKCFRNESTDARHEHTFHQCEGVVVGKGIKFSDMVGVLKTFFEEFFGTKIQVGITCEYFPFVEPGNGMEIKWENPSENILKITKGTGWLEVLGCGMIHPNVLKMAGIDSQVYSGFAWGLGVERLAMIKYGIDDVRLFHSGDLRFLEQF